MSFAWLLLAIAIAAETTAALALRASEGFTRPWPAALALAAFTAAFYVISVALRTLPVSIAYPVWAGAGTACIAAIGVTVLGEDANWRKGLGVALVVAGIVTLNLASAQVG